MAHEDRSGHANAWTTFWTEQGAASQCLANIQADVRQAMDDHWSSFAAALPPAAKVLDIGCGAGAVARAMLARRDGLRFIGIDLAMVPPAADPRIELVPATRMEAMPFADACFNAAVSQFGFEYGNVRVAATELARVLVHGAPFSFLIHHADSVVVRRNSVRNEAFRSVLSKPVKTAFLSGNLADLDRQLSSVRRLSGGDATIEQVAQALRARIQRGAEERAAIWSAVADALAPEREILDAMVEASVSPTDLDRWLTCFAGPFEITTTSTIQKATGEPIAWKVQGVKVKPPGQKANLREI